MPVSKFCVCTRFSNTSGWMVSLPMILASCPWPFVAAVSRMIAASKGAGMFSFLPSVFKWVWSTRWEWVPPLTGNHSNIVVGWGWWLEAYMFLVEL